MAKKYDVFISYRRLDEQGNISGRDQAHLIAKQLELVGYHPFFDYSEIADNEFAEVILPAVKSSKVFIFVLTKNALDRCKNEDDWVRREIETAINSGNEIIIVSPDNTNKYPDNLPKSLERIKEFHISTIEFGQLFDSSMTKLIKERIAPKIGRPKKKLVSLYYAIVAFLLPFICLLIYSNFKVNSAYNDVKNAFADSINAEYIESFGKCCIAIDRGSIDAYYHKGVFLGNPNNKQFSEQEKAYRKGYDAGSYRCAFGIGTVYYNQFVRRKEKSSTRDSINAAAESARKYFNKALEGPSLWDKITNLAKGQGFVDEISDKDKDTLKTMIDSLDKWKEEYEMR